MKNIRINKVIRDIIEEKTGTIIVLIAMVLGTFSVALLTSSNEILNKNLKDNYLKTNPASFTLIVNDTTQATENTISKIEEIKAFEQRSKIPARFKTYDNKWLPMWLFIVNDFDSVNISKFWIDKGKLPLKINEIGIERAFRKMTVIEPGYKYDIIIPGKNPVSMLVSGKIYDPGLAPSWMENMLYGYIGKNTANSLGISSIQKEFQCVIKQNRYDMQTIEKVVIKTKALVESKGIKVIRTEILTPGEHPHESQMKSLMFLLQMFGILILILSSSLIINMINSIMNKQIRQIGIMKAIGASNFQVISIYVSFVMILALIANIIAIPVGYHCGVWYSGFVAGLLNFNIFNPELNFHTYVFLIGLGICLPILISLYPIIKTSKTTIQKSLNDFGVEETNISSNILSKLRLSSIIQYGIKNTFRQKVRLFITLSVLVLGGAIFITSFNIRNSANETVRNMFDGVEYDFQLQLSKNYPTEVLDSCLQKLKYIKNYDYMQSYKITVQNANGLESESFSLRTVSSGTSFYYLDIIKGVNLKKNLPGVVINNMLLGKLDNYSIGSKIKIKLNDKIIETKIIGINRDLFVPPTMYIDNDYLVGLNNLTKSSNIVFIKVDLNKTSGSSDYSTYLEKVFSEKSVNINIIYNKETFKKAVVDHLVVIMSMLILMTILLLIVGGLGLSTTMGINVVERKRELGVLRAIGVNDKNMYRILLFEGISIGLSAWIFSVLLSVPLSYYLGNKFFTIFFDTTLNFSVSILGIVLWFAISIFFSFLAIIIPARSISKMNVSKLISYE